MKFPEAFRMSMPGTDYHSVAGEPFGVFIIPPRRIGNNRMSIRLKVIASDGSLDDGSFNGWEHVSVSPVKLQRCPTWEEMEMVRELFWEDDATVVQFSAPRSQHISIHHFCLHLWRPTHVEIPMPPPFMV